MKLRTCIHWEWEMVEGFKVRGQRSSIFPTEGPSTFIQPSVRCPCRASIPVDCGIEADLSSQFLFLFYIFLTVLVRVLSQLYIPLPLFATVCRKQREEKKEKKLLTLPNTYTGTYIQHDKNFRSYSMRQNSNSYTLLTFERQRLTI